MERIEVDSIYTPGTNHQTEVRIHVCLEYGQTVFFAKFDKNVKIDSILKMILSKRKNILRIHINKYYKRKKNAFMCNL